MRVAQVRVVIDFNQPDPEVFVNQEVVPHQLKRVFSPTPQLTLHGLVAVYSYIDELLVDLGLEAEGYGVSLGFVSPGQVGV